MLANIVTIMTLLGSYVGIARVKKEQRQQFALLSRRVGRLMLRLQAYGRAQVRESRSVVRQSL